MNTKHLAFLAAILVSMFSFIAIAGAQPMDANRALSAKQQSIVPIAAFTANGDMEKLKTALNESLDAGNPGSNVCIRWIPAQSKRHPHFYGRYGRAANKRHQR